MALTISVFLAFSSARRSGGVFLVINALINMPVSRTIRTGFVNCGVYGPLTLRCLYAYTYKHTWFKAL